MTITQIVEIPDNRRLHLDFEVPPQVPTGITNVIIQFPVREDAQPTAPVKIVPQDTPTPISDSLVGILSGIGEIDLDEIRMERLAKHL